MRVFIFGAGFSGQAIGERLSAAAEVAGTTRDRSHFPVLTARGITPFLFDGETLDDAGRAALSKTTHLVMSVSPAETGDPVLPLIEDRLAETMPDLAWIGYLSTVGVYGNHDGAWVDEDTSPRPVSKRSIARLETEERWSRLGERHDVATAIIRLSGIYGPGRNTFRSLNEGRARRLVKPGQVFNRIHVEDIAGASALLAERRASGIFNVTDDMPAPPQDLVTFAAGLMGVKPPPPIAFEDAELSAMARSFYGENKRVSNDRIKNAGYRFVYPDYRAGLEALWHSSRW
ncbi:SDR family oxidoreductase [Pararhizobium mangrovi]|uniref:SDR family oxidoreductase n=1 Tax=Pararhizobium mangrovi TaxID=2590452 RepID=A0A506U1Z3_9HYPH|nr:SDR family oxidoreductase [Pararhizobium mangrovi]TPW28382.1 SDR family oxidoreductase [Pararhizobium mangrovi]